MAYTLWYVVFNDPSNCIKNPQANASQAKCGDFNVLGLEFIASVFGGSPNPSLIAPNTDASISVLYGSGGISDQFGTSFVADIARAKLTVMFVSAMDGYVNDIPTESTISLCCNEQEQEDILRKGMLNVNILSSRRIGCDLSR